MKITEKIERYLSEVTPEDQAEYNAIKAKRDAARKAGKNIEADLHDSKLGELRQRIVKSGG
jgi:hypothetical protein